MDENKIIPMPIEVKREDEDIPVATSGYVDCGLTEDTSAAVTTTAAESESADEPEDIITDPDNPINEVNAQQLGEMVRNVASMVQVVEKNWMTTRQEFGLNKEHMDQLFAYNNNNYKDMPDDISDEDRENWDHFNGLDNITDEELLKIFGEGHKILGVDHSQTMDRVKEACNDFLNYLSCMKEYKQIHDAYLQMVDMQELKEVERLREVMEKEEDPEKKALMKQSLDTYYSRRYLDFLTEPLEEKDITRINRAWHTASTIEYYIKRARDKLKQLKVSSMFLSEISKFEIRFLPEKYHKLSNMFLVYFMSLIIYADCYDAKSENRNKGIAIIIALDSFITNKFGEEDKQRIANNMMVFLDQFMDLVEDPKPEE